MASHPAVAHPYRTDDWQRDIYPMPSFPVLLVRDLTASSEWYQRVLGFADVFTMRSASDEPVLVHLRWCRYADLLLTAQRTVIEPVGIGMTLNFMTESADDVAKRARDAGGRILEGPVDRPWNARDVTIADPDGYRLNFTGVIGDPRQAAGFDEVVDRIRRSLR